MGLTTWFNKNFKPDEQDQAFETVVDDPTTDHQLLSLFDTGDFLFEPYVPIKTPEEYEEEQWDEGRELS